MPLDGCYNEKEWEKIEGIYANHCPVYYLNEYSQVFEVYEWLTHERILPYEGGLLQQPYLLMQYIRFIRSLLRQFLH